MAKSSIGNMAIGVNTAKNAPENNGDVGDKISQAGQGMATAFHGGAELITKGYATFIPKIKGILWHFLIKE